MPTYEYRCRDCGCELEQFQSIKAEPLRACPECGREALQRKVGGGAATLRFRGSGFYVTDYKECSKESCPCSESKDS